MSDRLSLHKELCKIPGIENVYFQPPESAKMVYPCIVYELSGIVNIPADNIHYIRRKRYTVTLIHKDPDNTVVDMLDEFKNCRFDRAFKTSNLYHYVFTLYD